VARSLAALGPAGAPALLGVMLESFLHAGRQEWKPGGPHAYGVSITDACIGFDETEESLGELARAWQGGRRVPEAAAELPRSCTRAAAS
jgi:3-deoxy-7-phosphoheptulonate synthase